MCTRGVSWEMSRMRLGSERGVEEASACGHIEGLIGPAESCMQAGIVVRRWLLVESPARVHGLPARTAAADFRDSRSAELESTVGCTQWRSDAGARRESCHSSLPPCVRLLSFAATCTRRSASASIKRRSISGGISTARAGGISRSCAFGLCLAPIAGGLLTRSAITVSAREDRVQHHHKRSERVCRDQGRALAMTSALPRVNHPTRQGTDRSVSRFAEHVVAVSARNRSPHLYRSAV